MIGYSQSEMPWHGSTRSGKVAAMIDALLQMTAMIAVGIGWRAVVGERAETDRRVLTGLVYTVLLPALVLDVLWQAPMGLNALKTALAAAVGVGVALLLGWRIYTALATPPAVTGAMILAAAFGNVTYLGLPVLDAALGPWARGVAIQYDLFACTPLLLTAGVMIATRYGSGHEDGNGGGPVRALLAVPPLWAALAAIGLHGLGTPPNPWLHGLLGTLGAGVVPLMLISLGMGLGWGAVGKTALGRMMPAVAVQLLITPLVVWGAGAVLGLNGDGLAAVVLEGAMPCMVLGIVICDRYRLDTALYAGAVSVSTLVSLVSLPLWFELVTA